MGRAGFFDRVLVVSCNVSGLGADNLSMTLVESLDYTQRYLAEGSPSVYCLSIGVEERTVRTFALPTGCSFYIRNSHCISQTKDIIICHLCNYEYYYYYENNYRESTIRAIINYHLNIIVGLI